MSHEPPNTRDDADHPEPTSTPQPRARRAGDEQQPTPGGSGGGSQHKRAERGVAAPQLARLRHQAGLSQAELAALAGIGVATISRLERGARTHYSTLDLLAEALGTTRMRLIKRPRQRRKPPTPRAGPET